MILPLQEGRLKPARRVVGAHNPALRDRCPALGADPRCIVSQVLAASGARLGRLTAFRADAAYVAGEIVAARLTGPSWYVVRLPAQERAAESLLVSIHGRCHRDECRGFHHHELPARDRGY